MDMLIIQIIIPIVFLVGAYLIGTLLLERRHLNSLNIRESQCRDMGITNQRNVTRPESVEKAFYVSGEAVIATDYFKSFVAGLRNLIGGEVKTYETLMARARREATLRMLGQARQAGAREVWNVRYETSNIRNAGRQHKGTSVEVFAFGTAVIRKQT